MTRNLVIYYSRRGENYFGGQIRNIEKGNAEQIAEFIGDAVDADVFEIKTVKEYSRDYMTCTEEAKDELKENARPELEEYLDSIDDYDNIFIVGPCWWGTYPMAMFTQLEWLSFKGKKVLPVMTHEGSGLGSAERDLKKMCSGAKVAKGLAVQGSNVASSEGSIKAWAQKNIK
ncbi:MAG: NAD(P)H-dependent oxidoreductase [Mogibacterium sp.]|nr:NAD(P)H-dependent oxidoreductase [Mogibacterium sp.]